MINIDREIKLRVLYTRLPSTKRTTIVCAFESAQLVHVNIYLHWSLRSIDCYAESPHHT